MRWTVAAAVVAALLLGGGIVALGGGFVDAPWSDNDGEPDDDPANGDDSGGSGPPDDGGGGDDDVSDDDGVNDDTDVEADVRIETYARNASDGNELESGMLVVTDGDGGEVLRHDVSEGAEVHVEGLVPGEIYTANVTEPNDGRLPPGSEKFDPGEVDAVAVVAGYEIRGADSHRFVRQLNDTGMSFSAADGAYAENGDAFGRITNDPFFWETSGIQFDFYTDGETDRAFRYTRSTGEWIEGERFSLTDSLSSATQFVKEPYGNHSPDEWRFIEARSITGSGAFAIFEDENPTLRYHIDYIIEFEDEFVGTIAHVYYFSSNRSEEFANEFAYVDPETGYVVRYGFDFYPNGDPNQQRNWVYDFFDHGEVGNVTEYYIEEIID